MTDMLEKGYTPEKILEELLADLELELNDRIPAEFYCNCSRDRVAKALISLGEKELTSMIAEGKPVELVCHFCSRKYQFSVRSWKKCWRRPGSEERGMKQGFVKAAAATPKVVVADCAENTDRILESIQNMREAGAKIMVLRNWPLQGIPAAICSGRNGCCGRRTIS